jgi:hypothetical protein
MPPLPERLLRGAGAPESLRPSFLVMIPSKKCGRSC